MKTILIISTWLTIGPQVSTHGFEQISDCRIAMKATAEMIRRQALTNVTAPHRELQVSEDSNPDQMALLTASVGREVARLRCVAVAP